MCRGAFDRAESNEIKIVDFLNDFTPMFGRAFKATKITYLKE